ncbi:hypothetical protein [Acidithiobacillus caldus]|nr:hypothetical protein [Acidithiobacillus caldus]MBU2782648.1 hypothetical protein [Acidithiobacillus caldus]
MTADDLLQSGDLVWVLVFGADRRVFDPNDFWPVWETADLPVPNLATLT